MDTYDEIRRFCYLPGALKQYAVLLRRRIRELEAVREKALRKAPQGVLKVESRRERFVFYRRTVEDGRPRHHYISKSDKETVYALAARQYTQRMIPRLQSSLHRLEKLAQSVDPLMEDRLAGALNPLLLSFCDDFYLTGESSAELWSSAAAAARLDNWNLPDKQTLRGELVRSKSEVFIADSLFRSGIRYKYEQPLMLESGSRVHPDFTILHPATHEQFYWEHFGMMDDEDYRADCLRKISMYWNCGPIPGQRLICTFESARSPMSSAQAEKIIRAYFLDA